MAKKKVAKPASGGARMKAAGKKPMLLGWTPEQHATLKAAAKADNLTMTQLTVRAALAEAQRILKKAGESP